jgi:hypothetical protein
MLSLRALGTVAAATGLIAAMPAGALAAPTHSPKAHADGGDATALVYPSIVNTRLVRAQNALDKAARYADQGAPDKAIVSLTAARNNLSKAWTGAKYVIETTPPPPAAADAFHKGAFMKSGRLRIAKKRTTSSKRAHGAQVVPPAGAAPATPFDTGFAVLSLQHYAATTTVGLVPDSSTTTLAAVRSTLARSLNDRDAAIAYIHSIPAPPPAAADSVTAHTAGTPVAAGDWSTTMPNVTPQLDDELQQVEGSLAQPGLTGAQTSILQGADYRDLKTRNTVNTYWPPVPADA